jgi:hypothetical protein
MSHPLPSLLLLYIAAGYLNSNEIRRSEKIAGGFDSGLELAHSACTIEYGVRVMLWECTSIRKGEIFSKIGVIKINGFRASTNRILFYEITNT